MKWEVVGWVVIGLGYVWLGAMVLELVAEVCG